MKNIINYVLGKTLYANQLSKLEYSLTLSAFMSTTEDTERQKNFESNLKVLEQTFDKLPSSLKLQRITQINRYIDSTTTDEPMLYASYKASNQCYNIIVKTYLLNIFKKEDLNKNIKDKLINDVSKHIKNKEPGDLGKTLDFLKLHNLLEEKPQTQKTKKI